MKFIVDKKEMQQIANLAIKLAGKFLHACLVSDGINLRIIINSDSYVNIVVPSAKVQGKGMVGLQSEIFTQLFSLRGEKIKAEYDSKQNKLDVVCGSKVSFYVTMITKTDIKEPKINVTESIELSAKSTSIFTEMLKVAKYNTPDIGVSDYAVLSNTKDSFIIKYASNNSCAFYTQKISLAKKPFMITAPVSAFSSAFDICSSKAEISISDSLLLLKSDNAIISFPTLQDTTEKTIETTYKGVTENIQYKKGKIVFDGNKLLKVIKSIRAISSGTDIIMFKANGKKVFLTLESKYGKSKDSCDLIENTIGNVSVDLSELFLFSSISMASLINKDITLVFSNTMNMYKLLSIADKYSLECCGPIIK